MLTVLLSTARAAKCFTHHPEWNQFDVLARSLEQQTYRDFELVVVTPFVDEVRQVLEGRVERLTVVPPRDTPWRRERMFAVASARNTGLSHARGAWVLTIDDCSEFDPDFLELIVYWADRGHGVAVMYRIPSREVSDSRWKSFQDKAGGSNHIILHQGAPTPHGYISFPINSAVAINGYDELRFDGARGLEDMNFANRLHQQGRVKFVMDKRIFATLHDHIGYPEEIIDNEKQNARCCNTAHTLARIDVPANRTRYTKAEKNKILNCMFWRDDGKCGYHKFTCACPYFEWAKNGHPIARRVMLNDEEELFDLAAARSANGIS